MIPRKCRFSSASRISEQQKMISLSLYFFLYFMFLLRSAMRLAYTKKLFQFISISIMLSFCVFFTSFNIICDEIELVFVLKRIVEFQQKRVIIASKDSFFNNTHLFRSWLLRIRFENDFHCVLFFYQFTGRSIYQKESKFIFLIYYRERNSLDTQPQSFPHLFSFQRFKKYKSMSNYYYF